MKSLLGTRVHCPYCYEGFAEREIKFRCTGRMSRQGLRCDPEIDVLLRDRTGFAGGLPPVFVANGRTRSAQCPNCGADTPIRVCPVCHSRLPVHFGKVRSRLIALVGAKETGKTVFMTVLVHELMHRVGDQLNAAISGADDNTRSRFADDYENPLYRESQLLPSTTTAGLRDRAPLVFRFTTDGRSPLAGPQHTLLSFFDTAGEDLRSQQSVEDNVRYLAAADSIMLLLDPLQMRGARALAAPGTRLPTPGSGADEPANVLENITDLILGKQGRRPNELIAKPLAIVFTKMDALVNDMKETSPLRRPAADRFDEQDSQDVHAEIQRLLARWEGSRIDQLARLHYRRYRYFGVSALGETPTQDNKVSPHGIRPYRITDPVLWVLTQFRAIRAK